MVLTAPSRSFFFQAEDGIRDYKVTGVQTCALPISGPRGVAFNSKGTKAYMANASGSVGTLIELNTNTFQVSNRYNEGAGPNDVAVLYRSEERRVGKECNIRRWTCPATESASRFTAR